MSITKEGRKYLGAAIGTDRFKQAYVQKKVSLWVQEVKHLTHIADSQPHAAYAALTHGLASRWTFLLAQSPTSVIIFNH